MSYSIAYSHFYFAFAFLLKTDFEYFIYRYLKNKSNQPKDPFVPLQRRASTVPAVSDYQDTYRKHATRPRSTKRPPRTPRERNPAPMTLQTSMRAEFRPKFHEFQGRPPLAKHVRSDVHQYLCIKSVIVKGLLFFKSPPSSFC